MFVVAAYAVAESVRPEAGLFATTVMGWRSPTSWAPIEQIRTFGEPVVVLLIGSLFIVLAAGVDAGALGDHFVGGLVLAAALALVVRPLAVMAATAGTSRAGATGRSSPAWRPGGWWRRRRPRCSRCASRTSASPATSSRPPCSRSSSSSPCSTGSGRDRRRDSWGWRGRPPVARWCCRGGAPRRWRLPASWRPPGRGRRRGRGRSDLPSDDLPYAVYTGLVFDLPRSGVLDDVGRAVVASRDDETDLLAFGLLTARSGSGTCGCSPAGPTPRAARKHG